MYYSEKTEDMPEEISKRHKTCDKEKENLSEAGGFHRRRGNDIDREGRRSGTFEEVIDMPTEKEYLPVKATVRDIPEVTTVETTTVVTRVGDKKRVSKKRVIKKVKDGKENIQLCEETPQEGEILDETTQPLPELEGLLPESIEDMPEEITVTDVVVITPETKDKIKRTQKRIVKKKKEGKQKTSTEKTEMVVDIEVLKILKPYESEVIFEDVSDIPHETTDVLPMKVESSQLPELTEVETITTVKKEQGKRKVIRKKIVKKTKGGKEDIQYIDEKPVILEEGIEPFPELENVLPEKIEDMPEEVTVTDTVVITPEKKDRVKKAQKRVIKKKKDGKQEVSTEEEETILDRESLSSVKPEEEGVTFEEVIDMPTEKEYLPVKATVRDIPEVTTVETTTVVTKVGDKKRVSKKRVIKKVKDGKENIQLCEETPQEGEILDETTQPLPELEGLLPESIEDMPEEITVTDVVVITPETKDKIKRTQKRIVKKKKEGKQETSTEKTEMVVDIEVFKILKPYESEVIFEDVSDIPHETTDVLPMKVESSQLPELTEVETITTVKKEQGKRKVIRKKIVKKTKGGKEDIQYIDEKPVILEEGIEPFPELENVLPEKIEDMPEEVTVTDTVVITPEKKDRVKKAQKRVIKKKKDGKQEVSTEEEETILDRESLSSVKPEEEGVTFEEVIDMPTEKEYLPVKATVRDIPEVTTVETTTVVTKVGDKKRVSKKRVIKKVKDGKENIQLCEETPQEGEILDETTQPLPELEGLLPESIEDMPEEITVTDVVVITPETKDKIKRTQKRVVKKKKEGKQETSTEKKEMVVDIEVLKILKPYESEVIFEDVSDIPPETTDVLPMKVESSQLPELTEVETITTVKKEQGKRKVIRKKIGVIPHIKIRKKGLINIGPKMLSYQVIQGERFRLNFSSPAATKPYGYLLAVN
ncbi:hypothetical protein J6590_027252 [Homalodisca vitripennis]|nr:hypothetical protein J6590_027252 [Homalodisca vitripennis]